MGTVKDLRCHDFISEDSLRKISFTEEKRIANLQITYGRKVVVCQVGLR